MSAFTEDTARPADLNFDLRNPRMPDSAFADEEDAIKHLVASASLGELLGSIASSGWMDFEPLIVLNHDRDHGIDDVVVEGNRRLAALRLLADPGLARRVGQRVPATLHADSIPKEVRIWRVESRAEARDFIGFKHINGAFKWDSFAKAKYAADWLAEEPDIDAVSRRLGDAHNTVVRLVNGYRVLVQSERQGFDRSQIPGRFAFSHLYTGLTRPSIRDYVGIEESGSLLPDNPVPDGKAENLQELMIWLYGQGDVQPVIRSQNPDLKRLAKVLENNVAIAMLSRTRELDSAYDIVEDRTARFESELTALLAQAKTVSGLIGNFSGDRELLAIAETAFKTTRSIHQSMVEEVRDRESAAS